MYRIQVPMVAALPCHSREQVSVRYIHTSRLVGEGSALNKIQKKTNAVGLRCGLASFFPAFMPYVDTPGVFVLCWHSVLSVVTCVI
jgi:hypothetical protein